MLSRSKLLRSGLVVVAGTTLLAAAGFAAPAEGTSLRLSLRRPALAIRGRPLASASGLAAGDRVERTIELSYGRHGRFLLISLLTRARRSSLLDSDRSQGLRLSIDRCSRAWKKNRGSKSYTCRGKSWAVLPVAPLVGDRRLRHLSLKPRKTDHLRLIVSLPSNADNRLQNQTSKISYRFVGVQRTPRRR